MFLWRLMTLVPSFLVCGPVLQTSMIGLKIVTVMDVVHQTFTWLLLHVQGIYISDSLLVEVSDSVGEMGLFCFYFALLAFFAFRAPTWFTACGVTWLSDFAYWSNSSFYAWSARELAHSRDILGSTLPPRATLTVYVHRHYCVFWKGSISHCKLYKEYQI